MVNIAALLDTVPTVITTAAEPRRKTGRNHEIDLSHVFPTSNSPAFWLTAGRRWLAENGQYCSKDGLSSLLPESVGKPIVTSTQQPTCLSAFASHSLRRGVHGW